MATDERVISPSTRARWAFVGMALVQSVVVLSAQMIVVAGTPAAWVAVALTLGFAGWLCVRSYRVRVVLSGDDLVVHNPMRTYRMNAADLWLGLHKTDLVRVPVLAIRYASMGRWRTFKGGLGLGATGDYSGRRWKADAAIINEWLASRGVRDS